MPIRAYLDKDHGFDSEVVRVLGVAFEITRSALQIEDNNEPARKIIATKLIELARQGERNADRLADRLLTMIDGNSLEPPTISKSRNAAN